MRFNKIITLGILATFVAAALFSCNGGRLCIRPTLDLAYEPYGATDINAITGNRALSVGVNAEGTITVFKWPNPSYYDHVKYMTTTRYKQNLGALDNEGVFSGVHYKTDRGEGFFWLKDVPARQTYLTDKSPVISTIYLVKDLGLKIEQRDFVQPGEDLMRRHYRVDRKDDSPVKSASLVSYLNFSPQVSKWGFFPFRDWCFEQLGDSTIEWNGQKGLFIQHKKGKDHSTGEKKSVYIAFGFDGGTTGHQASYDGECAMKRRIAGKDAPYRQAMTGQLGGRDRAHGEVAAAIMKNIEFHKKDMPPITLFISAAENARDAIDIIDRNREIDPNRAMVETVNYWHELLAKAPLPSVDDRRIRYVALRSLVTLILGCASDSGAAVAGISTQPPYGLDWPRDGAYINLALLEAGFNELVRDRNLFYARSQSRKGNKIFRVPVGNWATNYYADGVPGFPFIWWEIDETGWALWSMGLYYERTQDDKYLRKIYPAVKRAADFLVAFKDKKTKLPRKAFEDDNPKKRVSLHGAVPVYLGLQYSAMAARALDDVESAKRWASRADELKGAMLREFWDAKCDRFVSSPGEKGDCSAELAIGLDPGLLLWPGKILKPGDPRAERAAEQVWQSVSKSFNGERERGSYEPYPMLMLAKYWKGRPDKMALVERGLQWQVNTPITNTGHFGEIWRTVDGEVTPGEATPQLWHHALFYLAAIEAYGTEH